MIQAGLLNDALAKVVEDLDRLGVRVDVAFRLSADEGRPSGPGVVVLGRGAHRGEERDFIARERALLLPDQRRAWCQVVATRVLGVKA